MKLNITRILAGAGLVALATVGTAAQARTNVAIGIGLPGVAVGYGAPVYAPQPVYVAPPAPVAYGYGYAAPQPVYVAPAPVYVAPPAVGVYYGPGYHRGWHRGHRAHWR